MAHVMGGAERGTIEIGEILFEISPLLYLAPGDIALARSELGLVSRMGRETVLSKAIASLAAHFDVCLIDTPPSLGLLTVNALVASTGVLVPVCPEVLGLRGLRLFLDTITEVQEELNPSLRLLGILVTMADMRTVHHRDGVQMILDAGYPVFEARIPRSIRVSESAIIGESITSYAPNHAATEAYRQVGEELLTCLDEHA
jgi:chromosome partitioning protein